MPLRTRMLLLLLPLALPPTGCRKPEPAPPPTTAAPPTAAAAIPKNPTPDPVPEPEPTIRVASIPPGAEPEPGYGVRAGDRAVLWRLYRAGDVAMVAEDWSAFRELERAILAGDRDGFAKLLAAGRVVEAPLGAEVLVLEVRGDPDDPRDTDPVLVRMFETDGSSFRVWTPRVCVARFAR